MFAYYKNYEEKPKSFIVSPNISPKKTTNEDDTRSNMNVFTYDYVIEKLSEYSEEGADLLVSQMAQWKLKTTENVLKAHLKHFYDKIAWYDLK